MNCPHCAKMATELQEFRDAMGLAADGGAQEAMRQRFRMAPVTIRIALKLYAAAGRAVQHWALEDEFETAKSSPGHKLLKVYIWQIRCAIGHEAVDLVPGVGYRLSPLGRARIYQTLNPKVA